MGEWSKFRPGDKAPNDGIYIEISEGSYHAGSVSDPQQVRLNKGERFPETSNHNRKWSRAKLK